MKVALYARYSTDNQRVASIADQFRMCRLQAEKQGWKIVEEYSGPAIGGSTLILRPGIQALINDGLRGRLEPVLAEALDRLSRDQEDIAGLYKRLRFAGVQIVTLAEGDISEPHVGLKGTMNALFLKALADKTRRGLRDPAAARVGALEATAGAGRDFVIGRANVTNAQGCGEKIVSRRLCRGLLSVAKIEPCRNSPLIARRSDLADKACS
jgi:DNA invertase Pin-like site-specific DNA recombinase